MHFHWKRRSRKMKRYHKVILLSSACSLMLTGFVTTHTAQAPESIMEKLRGLSRKTADGEEQIRLSHKKDPTPSQEDPGEPRTTESAPSPSRIKDEKTTPIESVHTTETKQQQASQPHAVTESVVKPATASPSSREQQSPSSSPEDREPKQNPPVNSPDDREPEQNPPVDSPNDGVPPDSGQNDGQNPSDERPPTDNETDDGRDQPGDEDRNCILDPVRDIVDGTLGTN